MKQSLAIVGGGTAGVFLAAFLDTAIYDVTIYERKKKLGRKFLVAGDGGFNLTHGEDMGEGSSGRVFPELGIKPIAVLQAIEQLLIAKGIRFAYEQHFSGWTKEGSLDFEGSDNVIADHTVFALGGASWKVTGSDGLWLSAFRQAGLSTESFEAANCAFGVAWAESFIARFEGHPLKNIALYTDETYQKGEVVITKFGLEGNAIYALSPQIQAQLKATNQATVYLDAKPTLTKDVILQKLTTSKAKTSTTLRQELKLSPPLIQLIKSQLSKDQFLDKPFLASYIKKMPFVLTGAAALDEAISTTGGLSLSAIDTNFQLVKMHDVYCIGEMLDWFAPTGGYLIQACASMGYYLAAHLNGLSRL